MRGHCLWIAHANPGYGAKLPTGVVDDVHALANPVQKPRGENRVSLMTALLSV